MPANCFLAMTRIVNQLVTNSFVAMVLVLLALSMPGCESLGYYWQAGTGHLGLMRQRQSVEQLLEEADLDPQQRQKLEQVVRIRAYADSELQLPVKGHYQHLVQLESRYVTWNVVAAEALAMESVQWCFPVAGCVTYRGYFDEAAAQQFAEKLRRQGYDVAVQGASAYSTLGWFKDPLLSSFLRYDDARMAALLFHELAHQVLYIKGDTRFNESFASAVEELALQQWLRDTDNEPALVAWSRHNNWVERFAQWLAMHRDGLQAIYQSELDDDLRLGLKQAYIAEMKRSYPAFRDSQGGDHSLDAWMQRPLNNATLLSMGSYNDWVVAFKNLFRQQACQWPEFYRAAQKLAGEKEEDRLALLQELQSATVAMICNSESAEFEHAS